MKNSKIIIALVAVVFVIGAIVIIARNPKNNVENTNTSATPVVSTPSTNNNVGTQPSTTQGSVTASYSLADVSSHKSPSDCWSAINGKVYNLTPWISKHPGGSSAIISLCGIDGSTGYNGAHGQQKRPANELAGFMIGLLK